ncbi:hypothetical protein HK101_000396 [Irineochytrium annulatum]|nr:hypothetical protein HK101_000396 [Irineochytrium annulatum]
MAMGFLDLPDEILTAVASWLPATNLARLLSLCRRTRRIVDANLAIPSFAASCVDQLLLLQPDPHAEPTHWDRLGKTFCDALLDRLGLTFELIRYFHEGDHDEARYSAPSLVWSLTDNLESPEIESALRDHLLSHPTPTNACDLDHLHFFLSCRVGLADVAVAAGRRIVDPNECPHTNKWGIKSQPMTGVQLACEHGHDGVVRALHGAFRDLFEEHAGLYYFQWVEAAVKSGRASTLAVLMEENRKWTVQDALNALRDCRRYGFDEGAVVVRGFIARRHPRRQEWIERNAAAEKMDNELTWREREEYAAEE